MCMYVFIAPHMHNHPESDEGSDTTCTVNATAPVPNIGGTPKIGGPAPIPTPPLLGPSLHTPPKPGVQGGTKKKVNISKSAPLPSTSTPADSVTTPADDSITPADDTAESLDSGTPADDNILLAVRTKLFYKKGSEFAELGVGTLKIQTSSTGVVHLLLRNDTSLGNVLLNVKVTKEIPLSTNKKSVLMVCPAPNPPLSAWKGAVTYLLRVKTDAMAEEILSVIQKNI